ncbi:hypothetical protein FQA39_LY12200 [Lamprigera yunnana]|nr:hypothetical protein FQA39_LY12200 [Lamprigera yunnana]
MNVVHYLDFMCINAREQNANSGAVPSGWPLCLGPSGVITHLGSLSATLVRHTDCYICIRNRSAPGLEIALIWRISAQFYCQTIAEYKNPLQNLDEIMCSTLTSVMDVENIAIDDSDGAELPELLQNLLISVEHAIERVPLDELANPCPQCLQYVPLDKPEQLPDNICSCQCLCRMPDTMVLKKDTSIQTSPMFEYAGPIPHIDSDEDEDKELSKTSKQTLKFN